MFSEGSDRSEEHIGPCIATLHRPLSTDLHPVSYVHIMSLTCITHGRPRSLSTTPIRQLWQLIGYPKLSLISNPVIDPRTAISWQLMARTWPKVLIRLELHIICRYPEGLLREEYHTSQLCNPIPYPWVLYLRIASSYALKCSNLGRRLRLIL